MKKRYGINTGFRKWSGSIRADPVPPPANDDWDPPIGRPPRGLAKSARKERPRPPDGPEELDEGYWQSLLACSGTGTTK
jgi:hypothetical protein